MYRGIASLAVCLDALEGGGGLRNRVCLCRGWVSDGNDLFFMFWWAGVFLVAYFFFPSGLLFRGRRAVYYGLCTLYVMVLL